MEQMVIYLGLNELFKVVHKESFHSFLGFLIKLAHLDTLLAFDACPKFVFS